MKHKVLLLLLMLMCTPAFAGEAMLRGTIVPDASSAGYDARSKECKAADFDRALFLTFAILILDQDANAMGRARQYGELYTELPKPANKRATKKKKVEEDEIEDEDASGRSHASPYNGHF